MIKYISLLTFFFFTAGVTGGYSQSKLVFTGTYQGNYHPFDSILIEDLNTGSKIVKYYPDTLLYLLITGVDELPGEAVCTISQNYPNPYNDKTHFNIYLPKDDRLNISILNLSGKVILKYERYLSAGNHSFSFTGSEENIYLLSVKTSTFSSAIKMLSATRISNSTVNLEYNGNKFYDHSLKKGKSEFEFNTGDNLVFTGYMTDGAGSVLTDKITDAPLVSTTYTLRFEKKNRIVILMYHKITDSLPGNEYERNIIDFENDLTYFLDHNYQILSMQDLSRLQSGEMELISDGIIITFDDGYESNYNMAFPLLTKYKMPATFFLVTEWIETPDFMKWSEVWLMSQYLDNDGKSLFNMGSHSSSHPYLEQSAQYFATHEDYLNFLDTELKDSKTWITDVTGQTNIFLALPYGDGANNQDIINAAIKNGYMGIRTSVWKSFTAEEINLFALPAVPVLSDSSIDMIENYFKY
jgi:peptidoglycan/xylan/chitin deacetylase (PgdA/CDA1 family)